MATVDMEKCYEEEEVEDEGDNRHWRCCELNIWFFTEFGEVNLPMSKMILFIENHHLTIYLLIYK